MADGAVQIDAEAGEWAWSMPLSEIDVADLPVRIEARR